VTQLRASIRKLLSALDQVGSPLGGDVRSALVRDDDAQSGRFRPPNPADSGHLIRIIPAA
jgi:hypothetical protein